MTGTVNVLLGQPHAALKGAQGCRFASCQLSPHPVPGARCFSSAGTSSGSTCRLFPADTHCPEPLPQCETHPNSAKSCWGTKCLNLSLLILSRSQRGPADRTLSGGSTCQTANLGSTSALLSRAAGAGERLQLCRRRDSSASPHPHAGKAAARPSPTSVCLSFVSTAAPFRAAGAESLGEVAAQPPGGGQSPLPPKSSCMN